MKLLNFYAVEELVQLIIFCQSTLVEEPCVKPKRHQVSYCPKGEAKTSEHLVSVKGQGIPTLHTLKFISPI